MLRKVKMIAVIVVLLIVFVGCSSNEQNIVGVWHSEQENINMILNEDGTFHLEDGYLEHGDLLTGTYRLEGNKFLYTPVQESELSIPYTLKGDTLVLTYAEYTSTLKRIESK